ncbi:hypothetical protein K470DRAFT_275817 [Piedraia hortae CBS 480.64]|uniref:Uncharacterized protein n=1 Tax=Piedraia hortae CBS 480.64 TaxID=1314780 RepID=A0A6A7C3Y7_9PEZI|nr:hypothetical protein K470DRAFT_275817 [Piedraia hortae CBS 480.64]
MGSAENFSTQGTVRAAAIAMIILTTISFFGRFCGRLSSKQPRLQPEDVFISIAYIFFLGMCICYLVIVRKMYKISAVEVGSMAPYEGIIEDVHITVPVMLATTELLWAILWAVKFSFLFLYRKLMIRLPHYIRWWWAVFVFCLLVCLPNRISPEVPLPKSPQPPPTSHSANDETVMDRRSRE